MRWIADLCYLVAGILYLPYLCYQMLVQNKNRRGWRQRFGHIPARTSNRPCVWIHAVSLGEVNATRKLVQEMQAAEPDTDIVISATTDTGMARAQQLFPGKMIFRYPLDFSWVVGRALERIRPTIIVLMELEVWLNLVRMASARGVSVCVANGRFTRKSARGFKLIAPVARRMFRSLSWVGAQTKEIAARFRAAGVPDERIEVTGSMKWDTALVTQRVEGQDELAQAMGIRQNRLLVVLGSSGPQEEEMILAAWRQLPADLTDAQLAIVPRKPERFDEVARLVEKTGSFVLRRSELPDGAIPPTNTSGLGVLLGDTVGELRKFYALAAVVILGRTLVPLGGSDPMEVAALAKPIIVGPHTENFAEPIERLTQAGAILQVDSTVQLCSKLTELLCDRTKRDEMGKRALQVVRESQGATSKTLVQLRKILGDHRDSTMDINR